MIHVRRTKQPSAQDMKQPKSETYAPYSFHARDRVREKARKKIRQRVNRGVEVDESCTPPSKEDIPPPPPAPWDPDLHADEIKNLLHSIIDNNRAFFSLKNLVKSVPLLSNPIPAKFFWNDKDSLHHQPSRLRGHEKLYSWHYEGMEPIQRYLTECESIIPMDYAILFQRYFIVGSFILGGINPCLRGRLLGENEPLDSEWRAELDRQGRRALQIFFQGVPLTLSSYIAKRSFDLRFAYWQNGMERDVCDLCHRSGVPRSLRLFFDASSTCRHVVCEPCFWRFTLKRLGQVEEGEIIVVCPCCWQGQESQRMASGHSQSDSELRGQRFQESRSKFYQLPKDGKALKDLNGKIPSRKIKNGRFILASTWAEAVRPLTGSSQDIRTERFFNFVESNSVHRLKGCIEEGMDLDLKNQYGMTALHLAAWYGRERIAYALLEAGANVNTLSNDGTSPYDAALHKGFDAIVSLLQKYGGRSFSRTNKHLYLPKDKLTASELIPRSMDHPGAGSYTIDGILDKDAVKNLMDFWKSLPVAPGRFNKTGPCSERRYFCDAQGIVTSLLHKAVFSVNKDMANVFFFPFMRFLCYFETGTILAPHVDLSRVDVETDQTSTHTFLLYLTDCTHGGATSLLRGLSGEASREKLSVVRPLRGRLLLFPHHCPHEGEAVVDVPKLLIRGEAFLPEADLLKK